LDSGRQRVKAGQDEAGGQSVMLEFTGTVFDETDRDYESPEQTPS
jgi:hypothetical protein